MLHRFLFFLFLTYQICLSRLLTFPTNSEGSWLLLSQVTVPSVPGATAGRKFSSCNSWQNEQVCRWGHCISTQQSLQTCQLPLSRTEKKWVFLYQRIKLVARFKPRGFKLNLATLDEPFVTRISSIPLLHHLLYSEMTQFTLSSGHKQNVAHRCLPLLSPVSPEGPLPDTVMINKCWWMVCYLHCQEELLAGREANRKGVFPHWWCGRSEMKRFVSSVAFGESVEATGFFWSSWGQELFPRNRDFFEEGVNVKTWLACITA